MSKPVVNKTLRHDHAPFDYTLFITHLLKEVRIGRRAKPVV